MEMEIVTIYICSLDKSTGKGANKISPPSFLLKPDRPVFVPSQGMTEVMINSTPMEDMRLSPSKDRLSFQVGHTCMHI